MDTEKQQKQNILIRYLNIYLLKKDLKTAFGVTGGGAMFLNEAFRRQKDLNFVFMHHEQSAAMAASAMKAMKANHKMKAMKAPAMKAAQPMKAMKAPKAIAMKAMKAMKAMTPKKNKIAEEWKYFNTRNYTGVLVLAYVTDGNKIKINGYKQSRFENDD